VPISLRAFVERVGGRIGIRPVAGPPASADTSTEIEGNDSSTRSLGRHGLVVTSAIALAGSFVGLLGIREGLVTGLEIELVATAVFFTASALIVLLCVPRVPLQTVATLSTVYYAAYLCAGPLIVAAGSENHLHLYVYLIWFFPLLGFNKLVNAPITGRTLSAIIRAAPFLVILSVGNTLLRTYGPNDFLLLGAYCLSYLAFGTTLNIVTRYREEYLVAVERAESLKAEAQLLESISDCFVSVDAELRLEYLNGAACLEFGIERQAAVGLHIERALPGFLSESTSAKLRAASVAPSASAFEAPNASETAWYSFHCYPRKLGVSIFFRNISVSFVARRKLEEAQERLAEQAELLDHASDAILVQDMDDRIIYWNKGAERLYGWAAEDVMGRRVADVFPEALEDLRKCVVRVLQDGEWAGAFSQHRRDGSALIVESRAALVRGDDGEPRSILVIGTDVTSRRAAEERIEQLAFYDPLTNLPNRYMLRERLGAAIASTARDGGSGALLLVNLDDFRTPNDTLGHDVGDALLRQAALRISGCVGDGDTVARLGGDEFIVLLVGLSYDPSAAAAAARAVGESVREAFRSPYNLGNFEYRGSVTVGARLFAGQHSTVDELLSQVDLAMYQAKAQGRNTICFFDPSMQTLVAARASLQSDLRRAVENHEFELFYQPVVDGRGRVLGAEALLRWEHPVRGMVPPNEFIPLAEESGLIAELGRWVLETACAQLAKWASSPQTRGLTLAVNVSLRELLDSNFVNVVLGVLQTSGADPRMLRLEITESCAMTNADDTIAKMILLKDHFVGFSIDDFGTGYSSLAHLRRLPLDILKVDRAFVSDVLTDARNASVVRTIIALGRNLGLFVIAEGVETEEQRQFLEAEGCDGYQGFLFSPAVRAAQFEAFVAARLPA